MPTSQKPKQRQLEELACIYPYAAGRDIGSAELVVAVPSGRDGERVRVFPTFTADLHALGLLKAAFRPDAEIRTLRTLVR